MDPSLPPSRKEDRYLRWIALLNLGKGVLFFLLAFGLLGFLHKDVDQIVGNWMSLAGFNMENHHVVSFLARLDKVTDRQIGQFCGITFFVAGVFVTEGTGLLLKQEWAKYLTVCVTGSLIPVEIYESIKHFGWLKFGLLTVNMVVVAFLVVSMMREKRRQQYMVAQAPQAAVGPRQTAVSCETV